MESFCIRRRTLTTVDLYEGQISLSEFAVLNVLHDRADISTGGWKINSTALATFCGGSLSVDQADRLLRSLDRKGYIKRWPSPKHEVYPYLIHGYYITDGVNKGKYLNAHKTTDWKSPVYEAEPLVHAEAHPQAPPQTHPQTAPQDDGQNVPHPQGHPQTPPHLIRRLLRKKEAFFADKYIRITENDTREGISKAIYRGRDRQDSNQSSDPGQESQNQTPGVSASAPVPAKDLPAPVKELPGPAKELPAPTKDLLVPGKDLAGLAKDLTAPLKPVLAKDLPVSPKGLPGLAKVLPAPVKERPDAAEAATHLLKVLGTPKRFNNPPTVSHWSELMAGLIEETELGVVELAEFITWAVRDNINEKNPKLSSAQFIPKAKDPCQTLLKHSMGSNPWLLALWESQLKLAQKKEASATTISQPDVPEFGKGGVSSFGTYMDKLRAAKQATYNYPTTHKENQ
jgi:hypothetical protein